MDAMVPDSAATAFSMYSGVKSQHYTMGYDANIKVSHCVLPISVQVGPSHAQLISEQK